MHINEQPVFKVDLHTNQIKHIVGLPMNIFGLHILTEASIRMIALEIYAKTHTLLASTLHVSLNNQLRSKSFHQLTAFEFENM